MYNNRNNSNKKFNNNKKENKRPSGNSMKTALNNAGVKPKLTSRKFVKTFNDFFDGIQAICGNETIEAALNGKPATVDAAIEAIIELAKEKKPSLETRTNLLWEFQISGNKVSVKTDKYVSFGWYVKSIKTDDGYDTSYIFNVIVFGDKSEEFINFLTSSGWNEDTYKKESK